MALITKMCGWKNCSMEGNVGAEFRNELCMTLHPAVELAADGTVDGDSVD